RLYYLSMGFLIGRSLSNNVTNLLLDPFVQRAAQQRHLDWLALLEQEPDAGLGNGGLGRLAACFLDSMATMQLPAMGYGLRYEYGMFRQSIDHGWQREQPDHWLRRPDAWEIGRPEEKVDIRVRCSFELRAGRLAPGVGRPCALRAGVRPGRRLPGRSDSKVPPRQRGFERAPQEGRDPAQRHPPVPGCPRADAHPARRREARMGSRLGPHPAHAGVHQPHAPAR